MAVCVVCEPAGGAAPRIPPEPEHLGGLPEPPVAQTRLAEGTALRSGSRVWATGRCLDYLRRQVVHCRRVPGTLPAADREQPVDEHRGKAPDQHVADLECGAGAPG